MARPQIAYLGPEGTYSHLVAEKRYGKEAQLVPMPTILDVCGYVAARRTRKGVIPIENSSGGAIHETVDVFISDSPPLRILEEFTLNVRLALLGRKGSAPDVLYSHFAPLEHCATWLRTHLPNAERRVAVSTAEAAQRAAETGNAAALGSRRLARLYGLDVLHYPVDPDVPNVTAFVTVGRGAIPQPQARRTTLVARLPNMPGSLCTFLEAFRNQSVNLSKIVSRPIRGCPREYAFLVDLEGSSANARTRRAVAQARKTCVELRCVGSYPCRRRYTS